MISHIDFSNPHASAAPRVIGYFRLPKAGNLGDVKSVDAGVCRHG